MSVVGRFLPLRDTRSGVRTWTPSGRPAFVGDRAVGWRRTCARRASMDSSRPEPVPEHGSVRGGYGTVRSGRQAERRN